MRLWGMMRHSEVWSGCQLHAERPGERRGDGEGGGEWEGWGNGEEGMNGG